jgi:hypothetical protein
MSVVVQIMRFKQVHPGQSLFIYILRDHKEADVQISVGLYNADT